MVKMNQILKSVKIQRVFFSLLLFLWIYLNLFQSNASLTSKSSFGISYFWIFLFVTIILLIRIVIQSKFSWILSIILFSAYEILLMVRTFKIINKRVIASFDLSDLIFLVLVYLLSGLLFLIVYKMKPRDFDD
jgi:hypothetical protein